MSQAAHILVVDDEVNLRNALARILGKASYSVEVAAGGEQAVQFLQSADFHVLLVDLKMPDMNGLDLLKKAKSLRPDCEVVVMTAYGSIDTAITAIREGAYDYLTKPLDQERLLIVIEKALEHHRLRVENQRLRQSLLVKNRFEEMVGKSSAMKRVYDLVNQVAATSATVLITGESGTGKELVARAVHQLGPRKNKPFVTLNCGALPDTLFESELFGYEKGAFTGAVGTKVGRFELAHEGTLFLDEVGEMNLKSQVDFLRVLESREFRRIGGTKLISVDVRFIAATNRNLLAAISEGRFREDLYYRLNVIPIPLPPLRERREDTPLLVDYFLHESSAVHRMPPKRVSPEAMKKMMSYSWPGNIRELKNLIERMVVLVRDETILLEHLPPEIRESRETERTVTLPLGKTLEEVERWVIERTLSEITSHREKAAKILGISTRALQYKIKEYGIKF